MIRELEKSILLDQAQLSVFSKFGFTEINLFYSFHHIREREAPVGKLTAYQIKYTATQIVS